MVCRAVTSLAPHYEFARLPNGYRMPLIFRVSSIRLPTYLISIGRFQHSCVDQLADNGQLGRIDWIFDPDPNFSGLPHFLSDSLVLGRSPRPV
jgi:hypothetical protein